MKLVPCSDWMILEEEKESGSIIIPEKTRKEMKVTVAFKIITMGPGWYEPNTNLFRSSTDIAKVGDLVLLDAPMVARFRYASKEYIAAQVRNIAFIVK